MRTADEVHVMLLQEARYYVGPECEAHTSVILAPSGNVLVWVGPEKVAEETAVGNLSLLACALHGHCSCSCSCNLSLTHVRGSHDAPDLFHRVKVWAETAVHSEDLLVDDGGNG